MSAEDALVRICPRCRCLSGWEERNCPRCSLTLDWLDRFPKFHKALSLKPEDLLKPDFRLVLRAEIRSTAGRACFRGPAPKPLNLPVPGCRAARLEWTAETNKLVVWLDGRRKDVVPHQPLRCGHVEVVAWLKALPTHKWVRTQLSGLADKERPLKGPIETTIGRLETNSHQIYDSAVDLLHCVCVERKLDADTPTLVQNGEGTRSEYWIADNGSERGTFVNHRPIISKRLSAGDLVQIGHFQWTFNESDGFLLPVDQINGATVELTDVRVPERLTVSKLKIEAGQFVAVTGASGSGKSTLLQVLARVSAVAATGQIQADGQKIDAEPDWCRSMLGYLSQESIVHEQLTPRTILELSGRLRTKKYSRQEAERILRKLEIPQSRWNAPLAELSGGQAKRVRIASELVSGPRLLLLDEPASGLDREREESLMRILRSLSWAGCTVIVATHGIDAIDVCDRVVFIDDHMVQFEGTPREFRKWRTGAHSVPNANDRQSSDVQSERPSPVELPAAGPNDGGVAEENHKERGVAALHLERSKETQQLQLNEAPNGWHQLDVLVQRELRLLVPGGWNQWCTPTGWKRLWWRLLLPVIAVPAFFAFSFAIAFPDPAKVDLLAFFCVLAAIWMGGSQSLMAIVDEREVFDHESLLFLRILPYIAAKVLVYAGLAVVQSLVFVLLLGLFQGLAHSQATLLHPERVFVALALVNTAAVGIGLAISALSGQSRHAANLLLPLVMIAQIVFSVHVVGKEGGIRLHEAYKGFYARRCSHCGVRTAVFWKPGLGWTCNSTDKCRGQNPPAAGARQTPTPSDVEVEDFNNQLPGRAVSGLSYLTLSRPGDMALRAAFVLENQTGRKEPKDWDDFDAVEFGSRTWWWSMVGGLVLWSLLLPVAAGGILWLQTRQASRLISQVRAAAVPAWNMVKRPASPTSILLWAKEIRDRSRRTT